MVSVTFDTAPVRQSFGACNVVFDGVATLADGREYRCNVTATRGARKPEVMLRYLAGSKRGHSVPEAMLPDVRAAVVAAAIAHLAPMRAEIVAAARASEIVSADLPDLDAALAEFGSDVAIEALGTVSDDLAPRFDYAPGSHLDAPRIAKNTVEYHAGLKAFADGVPSDGCTYLAGGQRHARWLAGWNDAPRPDGGRFVVTGRDIDGAQYLCREGWMGERDLALVFTRADADAIATIEEANAARTRNPEFGIYQIRASEWRAPAVTSLAFYESNMAPLRGDVPVMQDGVSFYLGDPGHSRSDVVDFPGIVADFDTQAAKAARTWFVEVYCPPRGISPVFVDGAL